MYGVFILQVGDHIEKIDGNTVVGCRHFEVAKMLKAIPKGHQFILRVVEPLKAGFGEWNPSVRIQLIAQLPSLIFNS